MFEEEVRDPIDVSDLHIGAGKQVALLIVFLNSYSNVSLKTHKLVGLLGNDAHDVALLALNTKLSNSSGKVTFLIGCHSRAYYQCAHAAHGQK